MVSLDEAIEENSKLSALVQGLEDDLEQCVLDERGCKDELNQLNGRRAELMSIYEQNAKEIPAIQETSFAIEKKYKQKQEDVNAAMKDLKRLRLILGCAKQKKLKSNKL
jgi:chromosome segregation ATPase